MKTYAARLGELTTNGPAIMMVSAFLFAVVGFLIKIMGPSFRVWDIAFYRFGGSLVLLWIIFSLNPLPGGFGWVAS